MAEVMGNIDMPLGENYTGTEPSATANVEDSLSSIFREIGSTLKDVTLQGFSQAGSTVRTALANKIMASPEGQAQVSAYKMEYFFKYLPWAALLVVAVFLGGRFVSARG
jgi:hypothetical protein